ncbi:fructose-1,6-bisphosphatase-3 [Mobilisporobacter senegalensis]|uniref:Fructose-1,6-bisphosphatase class 3 n=1 Tax=Mobilisporobacter senegalensis TaxID=1329262 RepID=A0A3N1XA47_9FIRM|nr:fructose-1,6-bisphosphatase [Mobilisporobacter senegalensis]ROR23613.1 fructose-1,6-bisphosphatase-3 [Mobilisporobacter senegalensis]
MDSLTMKYLKSMAIQYSSVGEACTEIINLQSILNLPKGTEHFISDIHGEYEQFIHILKNGSGAIKNKIDVAYGNTLSNKDKKSLASLIYYPEEKLKLIRKEEDCLEDWYKITFNRLIQISRMVSTKYTRSKVRKALPRDFAYVIEELLNEKADIQNKEAYYNEIIATIIRIGKADDFIIALCDLIQRLVIDHLHIIGDIFDRGPGPHVIMDTLMKYHSVDIQWGNHDILWMGAASGHLACIANVIRISAKHGNLDTLEDGYGINLIPLATFAGEIYGDDPCNAFQVEQNKMLFNQNELELERKMHKAIAIIQFKLEGQIIQKRQEFKMEDRLLLDKIDLSKKILVYNEKEYELKDTNFPTIDWNNPYELSEDEVKLMQRLKQAFINCEKLQRHIRFLLAKGSLYLVYNNNLLYHGCVPLNEDGTFREVEIGEYYYSGKKLYDVLEYNIRKGYYAYDNKEEKTFGQDIIWYIWSNENSPVYGKEKMATFERYFLTDKEIQREKKNYYYNLFEKEEIVNQILKEFGLDTTDTHIINGHMPVELKKGESPIKCNGKLLIIDGGFSKSYQAKTGIAGYTLIYNSYGLRLISHEPFTSKEEVIANESDIHSDTLIVERANIRRFVKDTDIGKDIMERINGLEELLNAYHNGLIKENKK